MLLRESRTEMLPRPKLLAFAVLCVTASLAQTPLPDPRHMRVEYEDERLRVIRLTLPPGESTGKLELNERINVSTNDAKLRVSRGGSVPAVYDVKAGSMRHESASEFSIENVGTSEWQCVITEFKGQFAKTTTETGTKPPPVAETKTPSIATPQPSPKEAAPATAQTQLSPEARARVETPQPVASQPTAAEPTSLNVDGAKMLFVNGLELAYIERGQGQPVVLVHDTLGDYRSWAQQVAALGKTYRVFAYSRRYHYPNHSSGKEHDYTYETNAKDLADFIRGLNAGPVRLVGFGYGATIAGIVAAEKPELVRALVLTEPGYEKLLDPTMAFRSQFAREEIYGIIRKPLTKDKPEKGVQTYLDWQGYQSWSGISTEEQYRMKQNSNALHAQTLDASPPNFVCATAKKITAPTLILSGQRRSPNSAEIAGVLSGCIPNAERATVSHSGAAVYIDNPSEADKLLMDFFSKH